jgi:P pilus assembly chaperone PapD
MNSDFCLSDFSFQKINKSICIITLLISIMFLYQSTAVYAEGISLSKQAINISQQTYDAEIVVTNTYNVPTMIRAKVVDLEGLDSSSFMIIPSLVKIEAGQSTKFKIIPRKNFKENAAPFMDRLKLLTVPARAKRINENSNSLQANLNVNVAYDLPLVYQGKSIVEKPWKNLTLLKSQHGYKLINQSNTIVRINPIIKNQNEEDIVTVNKGFLYAGESIDISDEITGVYVIPINRFGYVRDPIFVEVKD